MRFVIIDSGLDCSNGEKNITVNGITIDVENGTTILREGFGDQFGHGTAVVDIFTSNLCSADYEVFMVKVFFDDYRTTSEHLCAALEYINDNIECELILVSAGIRVSENYNRMQAVIDRLVNKNVILLSAFDNNGAMSYPAAFDNVIGVDTATSFRKKEQYVVRENSPINVVGTDLSFRVRWINNKRNIVKGSSFAAAYIAALVANFIIESNKRISLNQCMDMLKNKAVHVECYEKDINSSENAKKFMSEVNKAIVFPFNKEIHSLAKFEKMLCMEIVDYYDIRQSGLVGMSVEEITKHINSDRIIKDYECIDWEGDFDTVVLGHTEQLSELLNKNLAQLIIEKCKMYKKRLYSFDDIEPIVRTELGNEEYFVPTVKYSGIVRKNSGKQYLNSKPVLGVFGTSSRQGKYTLQLMLREMFQHDGYRVSQIGTEPTGYLFGFDYVYPMGYNSSVYINKYEAVSRLNFEIHRCEKDDPDIFIIGCQSQTVPRINYNINYYNLSQTEFILGTQPDLVVLCVNVHDDISYVERTIKFLEGICRCKVVGCCLYPQKVEMKNGTLKRNRSISEDEYLNYSKMLREKVGCLLYRLDYKEDMIALYNSIIDRLT